MGDWRPNPDPTSPLRWLYDKDAPTPVTVADYDPSATRVDLPAVTPTTPDDDAWSVWQANDLPAVARGGYAERGETVGQVRYGDAVDYVNPTQGSTFTTTDGSVYERPDPDEFPDFDAVDSTTIVDDGGPA